MKKNAKKGFTLVELLVVIAILAILSSVAVVGYTAFINKAEESKVDTELNQIVNILNAEYAEETEVDQTTIDDFIAKNTELQKLVAKDDKGVARATLTVKAEAGKNVVVTYKIGDTAKTKELMVKGKATE
ncbi:MAG: type II secretion system protein [Clostridia bacterium]|nr:type II secretion system protein [Clostridia bacterium]